MSFLDFWKKIIGRGKKSRPKQKRRIRKRTIRKRQKKSSLQSKSRKTKKVKKRIVKKPPKKTTSKKPSQRKQKRKPKLNSKVNRKSQSKTKKIPQKKNKEQEIGVITHYFDKISVGIIKLSVKLEVGEKIRIKGANTDFVQIVKSMQFNHQDIQKAKKGDEIGVRVASPVHENNKVYRVPS